MPAKKLITPLRVLIITTFVWCVLMPFVWIYSVSERFGFGYLFTAKVFLSELVTSAVLAILLPFAWLQLRWSIFGLLLVLAVIPILHYALSSTVDSWPMALILIAFTTWQLHRVTKYNAT